MSASAVVAAPAEHSAGITVPVTFFTTTFHAHMPTQVMTIPINILPQGLNEVTNQLLSLTPAVPFDFLVKNEYVTTTLERFMRRRGLTGETTMEIEYTPAMQTKEGNKLPHDDWVASVRAPVCGVSTRLITGSYDRCVRVWDGETCLAVGGGHTEAVKEVAMHPNAPADCDVTGPSKAGKKRAHEAHGNAMFASASKDGSIAAWAFNEATSSIARLGTARLHVGSAETVDVSADGSLVASGSWDRSVKVLEWSTLVSGGTAPDKKAPIASFTDHARSVLSVRFSPTQASVLYSTGLDGSIKVWDAARAQLMGTLKGEHAAYAMHCKPGNTTSSDLILLGCTDNRVRLFDSRQKTVTQTFSGHRQWIYGATWLWRRDEAATAASNQECFATASEDATVRVWDLRCLAAPLVTQDRLHTDGVLDVTYCGGNEIASCGKDNKTKTFTLERNTV